MSSNTDSGGASSTQQQQPVGEIPDDDYSTLLNVVSSWCKRFDGVDMMKVLLRQFKKKIGENRLQQSNDVRMFFQLLEGVGEASSSNHGIVLEAVKICGLDGVKPKIRAIKPTFEHFNFENVKIKTFSTYRQKLIEFGKSLLKDHIVTIGFLYGISEKEHNNNPWLLIGALEENQIIEADSVPEGFIKMLRSNNMGIYADIFQ